MTPCVTPIQVLKLEGLAAVYPDRIEIGDRNVMDAICSAMVRGALAEHCGGDQRECSRYVCGLFQLVVSAVPS